MDPTDNTDPAPPSDTCTCDTIAAPDCNGGKRGCDHPRPAPGHDPDPWRVPLTVTPDKERKIP